MNFQQIDVNFPFGWKKLNNSQLKMVRKHKSDGMVDLNLDLSYVVMCNVVICCM